MPAARRARGCARRGAAGGLVAHGAAATAGGLRARDRAPLRAALEAQLRPRLGLLPARVVHDEAQPAPARARRGAARSRAPAPAPGPRARTGRAGADVAPGARARGALGPSARLAAALRRLPRRARGCAAHACVPRAPRRGPQEGPDPGHRARHEPRDGGDGGPPDGHREEQRATAASTSRICARRPTATSRA